MGSPRRLTTTQRAFAKAVVQHYRRNGRHRLPWRAPSLQARADGSLDPYAVLVSEVMLQQTQVDRVIPKFESFRKKFPTVRALARAPLSEVLREWQGLGYNRRGKLLHEAAKIIVRRYEGKVPATPEALRALPGVGPYIAGAVAAFAYNCPSVFIETNIRTAYTHHFFPNRTRVTDAELLPLIEATLDRKNPRQWYSALMDYGSFLKRQGVKINAANPAYKKQSKFEGSDRQVRGAILRALALEGPLSKRRLLKLVRHDAGKVEIQLARLSKEGMVAAEKRQWRLP